MSTRKDIPLSKLLLNTKNPRIVECSTQLECLKEIYHCGTSSYETLLRSVINKGFLRGENILVSPDPNHRGKYIVEEGNRRISVLKLLHKQITPLEAEALPTKLANAHKKFPDNFKAASEKIPCLIFKENENDELLREIEVRHMSGEASRDEWPPVRKARFARDQHNKTTPELELLERYFAAHPGTDNKWVPTYPLTYLQDFIKPMAAHFGYADAWELANAYPDPATQGNIDKIIEDIKTKGTQGIEILENRRSKALEFLRENYPASGYSVSREAKPSPVAIQQESLHPATALVRSQTGPTQPKMPSTQGIRQPSKDPVLTSINEICKLSAQLKDDNIKLSDACKEFHSLMKEGKHPIASGIVLRALLDYTLSLACKAHGLTLKDHETINQKLIRTRKFSNDQSFQTLIDKIANRTLPALHTYVHNYFVIPSPEELRTHCATLLPLIKRLMQATIERKQNRSHSQQPPAAQAP